MLYFPKGVGAKRKVECLRNKVDFADFNASNCVIVAEEASFKRRHVCSKVILSKSAIKSGLFFTERLLSQRGSTESSNNLGAFTEGKRPKYSKISGWRRLETDKPPCDERKRIAEFKKEERTINRKPPRIFMLHAI